MDFIVIILQIPKFMIKGTIRFYQKVASPDHGLLRFLFPYGVCRYRPTCSEYALEAVDEHGIIRGLLMAQSRIWRCNPWSAGGLDPVPKKK
ncbi:MAG: hypothetical protein RLZZ324_1351 [Candidatus Parcubacteria bacterium]|jgi:putative membrane protein insertion efficiency factor